jgi:hypothetical protein
MQTDMDSSKGVFIKDDGQLAELVKKTLVDNGVKEKDIAMYDEAKVQKGSLIATLLEKTTSSLKLRLVRVEEVKDGDLTLIQEKEIESAV